MQLPIYIEVNIICLFILGLILYKSRKHIDAQMDRIKFNNIIISMIVLLIDDIIRMLVNGRRARLLYLFNVGINTIYLFHTAVVSYRWFGYSECIIGKDLNKTKCKNYLISSPLIVSLVLCICSASTGWLFYIDKMNVYHRGSLYWVQAMICYSYNLAAAGRAAYFAFKMKHKIKRMECFFLTFFSVMQGVAGMIQIIISAIPAAWVAATLTILMLYIDYQEHRISTDGLTGLNNRKALDNYLMAKIRSIKKGKKLFLLFIDINKFKQINDTYGHLEGDDAIVRLTQLLNEVCSTLNTFLCRYGGDEFAIVYECDSKLQVHELKGEIIKRLQAVNDRHNKPYFLSLSIGCSEYDEARKMSISEFIKKADEALYEQKRIAHLSSIRN